MTGAEKTLWMIVGICVALAMAATLYGAWFVMNCNGVVVRALFYPPLVCIEVKKITDRFPQ